MTVLAAMEARLGALAPERLLHPQGKVIRVVGLVIEATGPPVPVGELCRIGIPGSLDGTLAEVVGFHEGRLLLMPLADLLGVAPGTPVLPLGHGLRIPVGTELLGRVLDGLGRPIDGAGPIAARATAANHRPAPDPLTRRRVERPVSTGLRVIDGVLTVGYGQRIGIFAGSGVGKSVLLGMIARYAAADVNVIGLIGERGREVREFIEKDLGPEGLERSVVVVATSDAAPQIRRQAAFTATAVSEYFRDQGRTVLLMMDSLTRFAVAQREVGLTVGEPPTTRGYPPSVFALLPRLLERAGTCPGPGSITGLYTILVEGDDPNEPVADAVRSILDGHIVLSRALAAQGHFPAIDVLGSVSRCMIDIAAAEHRALAQSLRTLIAAHREVEPLLALGAYKAGGVPMADQAIARWDHILDFLTQAVTDRTTFEDTLTRLATLVGEPAVLRPV